MVSPHIRKATTAWSFHLPLTLVPYGRLMPFASNEDAPVAYAGSPLERAFEWTAALSPKQASWLLIVLWACVLTLDASTGRLVSMSSLYLVPLCFTTWCLGRIAGLLSGAAGVVLTLLINGFGDGLSAQASIVPVPIALWNAGMRIFAVVFVILFVGAFRRAFDRERAVARVDPLTGLGNRRSFLLESRRLSLERNPDNPVLLCGLIDLDDFKHVNDIHGHAAGDEALRVAAAALRTAVRQDDALARIGGDEFAFCLLVANEYVAKVKCQEIHDAVSVALTKRQWETTCSLGASAQNTLGAAFCVADNALYAAKSAGKGTWRFQV